MVISFRFPAVVLGRENSSDKRWQQEGRKIIS